jgi:hypothetical protein
VEQPPRSIATVNKEKNENGKYRDNNLNTSGCLNNTNLKSTKLF